MRQYKRDGFNIGDNVGVRTSGVVLYFKIIAVDSLFTELALDTVGAGQVVDFKEINALNPPETELLQIINAQLMQGNVKLLFKLPGSVNRFGTERKPETGFINDKYDTLNLNLFVVNNVGPQIKEVNDNPVSITPIIKFLGYRYGIRKLNETEQIKAQEDKRITFVDGTGIAR